MTDTDNTDDATTTETIMELIEKAAAVDGIPPVSEHFLRGLADSSFGHHHLLALAGSDGTVTVCDSDAAGHPATLAGVAAIHGNQCEMVVDPAKRRRGIGAALARRARRAGATDFWAHGDLPAAQAAATAWSGTPVRQLLVMEITGEELHTAASAALPPGVLLGSLDNPGVDLDSAAVRSQWLEVNNQAFSWHPEQGGWDAARLEEATATDWFDPAGVLFVWDTTGLDPVLAGFHWTKKHPDGTGEIYVVGLADRYRGTGLGGALISCGLSYLAAETNRVILYVEADNKAAVAAYRRLGFDVCQRHVVYRLG
ncbi:mycothiol synthase [Corynebacterium mendelii]|uniref:Mycothiol acetyltransferase n=1 Tax=Corynebacterium mendelii TaxID=2765362 RepID=A0A939E131_9CORY|nr:mycothiol synthase [Corynebacterium mendelii]MBN9645025.1 mycothiol synthase [Corynebacterium mendelii]